MKKHLADSAFVVTLLSTCTARALGNPSPAASDRRELHDECQCSDGRVLAMIGNLSKDNQAAEIDFGGLKKNLVSICDEYAGKDIDAPNGRVTLPVNGRQLRIVGF